LYACEKYQAKNVLPRQDDNSHDDFERISNLLEKRKECKHY